MEYIAAWRHKHPCVGCGTGEGMCSQGLAHNMMCCKNCDHPTRWESDPYTDDDLAEIELEGRLIMLARARGWEDIR